MVCFGHTCADGAGLCLTRRASPCSRRGRARLNDYERLRVRPLVGDRQMNERLGTGRQHRRLFCAYRWSASWSACPDGRLTTYVAPEHFRLNPVPSALAQVLLGGYLWRSSCAPGASIRATLPVSVKQWAVKRSPCRASVVSMRLISQRSLPMPMIKADAPRTYAPRSPPRHRLMVSARPTKIASPMRKWPMLSSTIRGRAEYDPARRPAVEAVLGTTLEPERLACAAARVRRLNSTGLGGARLGPAHRTQAPVWSSSRRPAHRVHAGRPTPPARVR